VTPWGKNALALNINSLILKRAPADVLPAADVVVQPKGNDDALLQFFHQVHTQLLHQHLIRYCRSAEKVV